jgi:hypothetical protein
MPFLLDLPDSLSLRGEEETYLTDLSAWARFFIAITAFILAEEQVEPGCAPGWPSLCGLHSLRRNR